MIRIPAAVVVLLLFGARALAEQRESLGLDLTEDEKKVEQKKKDDLQKVPKEVKPAQAATKTAAESAPAKPPVSAGERDIIQEDRVKSVQRKVYLKKQRFELAPS